MPIFTLNKLVRDKLPMDYDHLGQKAKYKKLTPRELKRELTRKIVEESQEIKVDGSKEEIICEIADIQQVLDDLALSCGITKDQIEHAKQTKYNKKGGFVSGVFVETIELSDSDEWVDYYRKYPEIFPEK